MTESEYLQAEDLRKERRFEEIAANKILVEKVKARNVDWQSKAFSYILRRSKKMSTLPKTTSDKLEEKNLAYWICSTRDWRAFPKSIMSQQSVRFATSLFKDRFKSMWQTAGIIPERFKHIWIGAGKVISQKITSEMSSDLVASCYLNVSIDAPQRSEGKKPSMSWNGRKVITNINGRMPTSFTQIAAHWGLDINKSDLVNISSECGGHATLRTVIDILHAQNLNIMLRNIQEASSTHTEEPSKPILIVDLGSKFGAMSNLFSKIWTIEERAI